MNLRKISILFSFLLLLNCGFEPIYSKKNIGENYNFSIEKITFLNQSTTNKVLENNLINYLDNEEKIKKLSLEINTIINKTPTLKNKQGSIEIFSMEIIVDLNVYEKENLINNKNFKEFFEYKNQTSKFNLEKYERDIQNSLTNKISNDIILYLYSIK